MATIADIECEIIDGYGRSESANVETLDSPNHSWNAVKLNNKWYLCDATWSAGYMLAGRFFVSEYNDGYFLTAPTLFGKNHYPLKSKWLLTDKVTKKSFTESPLYYGEAFKYKLLPESHADMNIEIKKNKIVNFDFKSLKDSIVSKIQLVYYVGKLERKIKINNLKLDGNKVSFQTKFKRRGFYNVHLKVDNDVVLTYNVDVIKN
jgi:transglutaminase/protease-like cytokinesis protein 3